MRLRQEGYPAVSSQDAESKVSVRNLFLTPSISPSISCKKWFSAHTKESLMTSVRRHDKEGEEGDKRDENRYIKGCMEGEDSRGSSYKQVRQRRKKQEDPSLVSLEIPSGEAESID